jgi:hypothetical protein
MVGLVGGKEMKTSIKLVKGHLYMASALNIASEDTETTPTATLVLLEAMFYATPTRPTPTRLLVSSLA